MQESPSLKRVLSLPQVVLYGLGTTIGAGIYALVGELAVVSGYSALASFVFAALIAALTALSFAELSGRFPQAAGAAMYVREGFGSVWASTLVGLLVIAAGLVSAAALVNAMVAQLQAYIEFPRLLGVVLLVLLLGAIALWGIAESVTIAGLITLVEIGGLLVVIWVSRSAVVDSPEQWHLMLEGFKPSHWGVAYAGALLAFYAFIGFEDMVVVAEEVKGVSRTLPLAILLTLLFTSLMYLSIMALVLLTFTPEELAKSAAPLVDMVRFYNGGSGWMISVVAMFAVINGALIQIIMASRVMYGLASRGQLPTLLARVNARTRTPLIATVIATVVVLVLAAVGRLVTLAELTSVIMLAVFAAANLALWLIKGRDKNRNESDPVAMNNVAMNNVATKDLPFCFPRWVPALGFLGSISFAVTFFLD